MKIENKEQAQKAIRALIDYSNLLGNPENIEEILAEELGFNKEHPTVIHHFAMAFLKGFTRMMDEYKKEVPHHVDTRRRILFEWLERANMRI